MSYYVGADLGQVNDYTALSVVREVEAPTGEEETYADGSWNGNGYIQRKRPKVETQYHVPYLRRFLGEPYTAIVDHIEDLVSGLDNPKVVVDATGVGRPVVDMIRDRGIRNVAAITITGGDAVTRDGDEHRVPKRDLVSTVQVLLQNRRLKIANSLELRDVLIGEMQNFKMKISADGHDSYEHWRDSDHDDLVLSVAMALWWAEIGQPAPFRVWDI